MGKQKKGEQNQKKKQKKMEKEKKMEKKGEEIEEGERIQGEEERTRKRKKEKKKKKWRGLCVEERTVGGRLCVEKGDATGCWKCVRRQLEEKGARQSYQVLQGQGLRSHSSFQGSMISVYFFPPISLVTDILFYFIFSCF